MIGLMAVSEDGFIGLGDGLPWHCPQELTHFWEKVRGSRVIVGEKTFKSLPKSKVRELGLVYIWTRNLRPPVDNLVYFSRPSVNPDADFLIGGKLTYETFAHLLDGWQVSTILGFKGGDVQSPAHLLREHDFNGSDTFYEGGKPIYRIASFYRSQDEPITRIF